ncbi:MAG: dTDP-4-dehydrorhamnose reductase [Ignavibacteriaceae bacterium]|jgi:dTDP-4-dehydrorhamnose reductase|nr:dTDP-4-dehydrorhamnose reductase [Ignavibacteriaceae bacterium]WKZ71630.1 MAG: dTDP-4-dehydrorhamnose reductase [Ignavibacteriaceae bacterium]
MRNKILIFGATGMLGQRCYEYFAKKLGYSVLLSSTEPGFYNPTANYIQCDATKKDEVKKIISGFSPDYIINAAAFTNVDRSETEREIAWKLNVNAVEYMAEGARNCDAHLIHISSDYIFDGVKGQYSENDKPNPLGYYGRTKLAGENALKISNALFTILRTNVLYGVITQGRLDFVRWVVESIRKGEKIRIVTDQINNPTFLDDLVRAIGQVIEFGKFGIYNIGGREFLSRYDFTMRICDFFNLDKSMVTAITTPELNQPAKRPLNSGLVTLKAETEFGYSPTAIEETFRLMKDESGL